MLLGTLGAHKEIEDIMKIVKFLEDSGFLIKVVSKPIQNREKK